MPAKKKPAASKPTARKAKAKAELSVSEEMFQQLFGDVTEVDEILQISFEDTEPGKQKNESITTYRPSEFLKTGDRISNDIVKGFQEGEAVYKASKTTPQGVEPIVTRVSFAYKNVDIFAPRDGDDKGFTSLDKEVHDAVVSLYAAGNKVFSPAMIYRTMAGKSDSAFVPQEKIQEVTASVYKCMSSIITIDASEEASIYGLDAMYSQNLIYAKAVTLKTKGWEVNAFMLIDEPVLYKYAKLKRQVFAVPLRVLDTPPSKTNDVIVLQGYLVRIVETLRRSSAAANTILYSTVYELLDSTGATKQKLLRIRNHVKAILDYWVEIGYITSYRETTQDRTKYSIELDVPTDQYIPKALLLERQ